MADSINDDIADKNIKHEVDMLRLIESERIRVRKTLKGLEKELIAKIEQFNPGEGTSKRQQLSRQAALLAKTQKLITATYRSISGSNQTSMVSVMALEADVAAALVATTVGVELLTVGVSQARMRALASEPIILGAPAREYWSRQSRALKERFKDQVSRGVILGESPAKIARRIRGTRAANFTNGIMSTTKAGADSLVRTSMNSAANAGRLEMYKGNGDVIKGMQAVVTFDLKTSDICIARAGAAWDLDGNPLPQSTRQEPFPPLPWHFNERTTLAPILKSFEEILGKKGKRLDRKLNEIPEAKKASMNGQIADKIEYEDWLKGRKVSQQIEALGATRQRLWSEGKIDLKDLIDQQGRPLTADQVRVKAGV